MYIWFSILIPIVTIIVLYIKFHKRVAFWESSGLLLFSVLLIWGMKSCTSLSQTQDVERYQDYVVKVEHHHYWNKWVKKTCKKKYRCGTKKDGSAKYCYYEEDCSYMKKYYPYTIVKTSTGRTFSFREGVTPRNRNAQPSKFLELIKKFGDNPNFVRDHKRDLHNNYGKGLHGEVYSIRWKGETERIEYATWTHTYENRLQASHSIESFPEVDTIRVNQYGLYEYPDIHNTYKCRTVIGENNTLDEYVNQKNSLIASKKQLKIFYVIYKNQPMDAAMYQEQYWGGGNKNEVNICIGLDDQRNIKWAYVFSWSKNEMFKVEIRDYITSKGVLSQDNFKAIIDYAHDNLEKNFKRREFAEFSYLTVEPPTWGVITTFILTFLVCVGAGFWIVMNEHDIDGTNYGYRR